jgi:hypothetical protein
MINLYTPEIYEPKIEQRKRNLENKKDKNRIVNSAFVLLFICDVILNALRDRHPNLVDVLNHVSIHIKFDIIHHVNHKLK